MQGSPADLTPLTELMFMEDEPAMAPVDRELVQWVGRRRLEIFDDDRLVDGAELCATLESGIDGAPLIAEHWVRERRAHQVESISRLHLEAPVLLDALRPEWITKVYNPRPFTAVPPRLLRSASGRPVHPLVDERVFGADDRVGYCPTGYPWTSIGKTIGYDAPGHSVGGGTAALVGSRSILTAAHTLPDAAWNGGWWAMEFIPGYLYGMSLPHAGTKAWVTDGYGYDASGVVGNDMVVLRLDKPLGDLLGIFGVAAYDDNWEDEAWWTHVGYPRALFDGQNPCRQVGIAIVDDDSGPDDSLELEHYGDAGRGDSGGPLFGWWGGDPRIIGTLSGDEVSSGGIFGIGDEDHNVHAGGPALVRLVRHARDAWG